MAKDKESGVDPIAQDGDPEGRTQAEKDQLAMARARRDAEAEAKAGNGRPIDGQEPAEGEEDDGQLFVYEQGKKVTLSSLIPRGVPVEHAFVFGSARRKGAGQLISFDDDVLLVIRGKVGSVKPVAKRKDDESVERVTIETQITPKVVVAADSDEAMAMLAGVLEKRGVQSAA